MTSNADKSAVWLIEGRYDGEDWQILRTMPSKEATTYDAGMFRVKNPGLKVRVRRASDGTEEES